MFCIRKTIELPKKDSVIHMRPLGDIHLGNLGCDVKEYLKNVKYIADHENMITIGMGDYIDNVMAYANGGVDKRWNPETIDRQMLTTEEQIETFVESWKPIADKTIGLHAGNHEWKTINQKRFINDFCKPFNLPYMGRLSYTSLTFTYKGVEKKNYLILSMHGGYAGMQAGGAVNRMKAITGDFDGDVFLMGHNHDTWVRPIVRTGYNRKNNVPVEQKIMMGNTGTFLRGYEKGVDSYVEINPKEAKRVGTITITFKPFEEGSGLYGHD